jgi:SH3 domain protein
MMIDLNNSAPARGMLAAIALLGATTLIFWAPSLNAQPGGSKSSQRWVSDQFEITMRSGKDNRKAIVRMLPSGAQLELLEEDAEAGYSRVRISSGAEGWVLNRYLMKRPPARLVLPDLESRLRKSQEKRSELEREIRDLGTERGELQRQSSQLEKSGSNLQGELDEIRQLSSNVIEVNDQNKQLKRRLI